MKILIFAHQLRAGGGKVTCINLLKNILEIDQRNTYSIVVPDDPEYRALRLEDKVSEVRYFRRKYGYLGLIFFDFLTRHQILRKFKPDLVWTMSGFGFQNPPCFQVVSIQYGHVMYDNKELEWLDWKVKLRLAYLRFKFRIQLSRTDLVIFQTNTMKDRCLEKYHYQGRTLVTYKGLSNFLAVESDAIPTELEPISYQYKLFYLTRYYSHKGLEVLVEMMDRYSEDLENVVLVITIEASQHNNARKLLERILEKRLGDRVVNVGPLKQAKIAEFYGGVDCLVMPTRLESFSSTYLEAMHFGVPIITTDKDFAREVCGQAAIYIDPKNAEDIKEAVLRVKNDPQLRKKLIENGQSRLEDKFNLTWKDIAEDILSEFDQIK